MTRPPLPDHQSPQAISEAMALVVDVFRSFRPILLKRAGRSTFDKKADGSQVTATDLEIELALKSAMQERFPDMVVGGEETGYSDVFPPSVWLIDPIDGTRSFIENTDFFTSMAVLIQDGMAEACVIYNPRRDVVYRAQRGQGAYKNGVRLQLAAQAVAPVAWCKDQFAAALEQGLQDHGVTCASTSPGAGYDFTMLADGQIAARYQLQGKGSIHDYAPGGLLVREAGGVLIPILEDTYTYATKAFVACHPALEEAVRAQLPLLRDLQTSPGL